MRHFLLPIDKVKIRLDIWCPCLIIVLYGQTMYLFNRQLLVFNKAEDQLGMSGVLVPFEKLYGHLLNEVLQD
jgi:hypothetical protein